MSDEEYKKWAWTRQCTRVGTPSGCKYGDLCFFIHGQEVKGTGHAAVDIPYAVPGAGAISLDSIAENVQNNSQHPVAATVSVKPMVLEHRVLRHKMKAVL